MDIHLTLRRNPDNTLRGEAVCENISGNYDFALDKNFAIQSIGGLSFEITHTMADLYRDDTNALVYLKANIYRIEGDIPATLKIEYEYTGNFSSDIAFNRISDEMIALDALYINFYPVPIAREVTEKIRPYTKFEAGKEAPIVFGQFTFAVEGFEPYRVINCEDGRIKQFCAIVPFKLLAVNESKILKKEHSNAAVYYFNAKESAKAAKTAEEASRILKWYSEDLFRDFTSPERMFFVSYGGKKMNGFNRSITVEVERLYRPGTHRGRQLLAHEIAHHWCMSEPPAVWNEQMLAEGCVEWSYLLYSLSRGRFSFASARLYLAHNYFAARIYWKLFEIKHRRKDYSPHQHGYRMFRDIYKKHGKGVLENCIRRFVSIETKTMDSFLAAVKANEPAEVYASVKCLAKKYL